MYLLIMQNTFHIYHYTLLREVSFFEELVLIVELGSDDCLYLGCWNIEFLLDVVWKQQQQNK